MIIKLILSYNKQFLVNIIFAEIQDDTLTMKWVRGDISNFDYIMSLNYLAGLLLIYYYLLH